MFGHYFFGLIAITLLIPTAVYFSIKKKSFQAMVSYHDFCPAFPTVHKSKSLSVNFSFNVVCSSIFTISESVNLLYTSFTDNCNCKLGVASVWMEYYPESCICKRH